MANSSTFNTADFAHRRQWLPAIALSCCIGPFSGPASAQSPYDTIALSGSAGTSLGLGPNLGAGVNFSSLTNPMINSSGQVAFRSILNGTGVGTANDTGIWTNAGGTLAVVAREGPNGPGPNLGAGVHFESFLSTFNAPVFNAAGTVAFRGDLLGTGVDSSNNAGIWNNASGTLTALARSGTSGPGPNVGAGVTFNSFGSPLLNAAGHVAFFASLNGANGSGIWSNAGGPLAVVARTGSAGPGPNLGAGVTFSTIGFPVLNVNGRVAFSAVVTGSGITSNNAGIWTNIGGTLAAVARNGSSGPGPNLGAGVNFSSFNDPVMNAAGQVAFAASITGTGVDSTNDSGIFTNAGGTLSAVAREGASGPGPNLGTGIHFNTLNNPVLNANGRVAFRGTVIGTGVDSTNDSGIFTNASGTIVTVAREGAGGPGPNLGTGVHFTGFTSNSTPVMNVAGQVAFQGFLIGTGVDSTNDSGVWIHSGGTLSTVVRKGDLYDVDPGAGVDVRTISTFAFSTGMGSGGEDGRSMTLNDDGTLAFQLSFADGTNGVFTYSVVPEPASLLGLCVGTAWGLHCYLRRAKRHQLRSRIEP